MRKRYIVLIVLLVTLSTTLSVGWYARRAYGEITIEKYDIVRGNGRVVSFRVYAPSVNTYGQPRPTVLTIHGISGSGAMMDPFNIELARRNFTVVSVDLTGHGRSSETFGFDAFFEAVNDAFEAVRYVQLNDPETHDTIYGVLGHSLGAGISLFFENVSILPQSTVIIGGGMGDQFGGLEPPINETRPRNLLLASGIFDELVSPQTALNTLQQATGVASPSAGVTYGNFTDGTARRLVFSFTNHLFETSDARIVTQSIDWLVRALQGEAQREDATLNPQLHVYQTVAVLDLIGAVSYVLSMLPIVLISYSLIPRHLLPQRIEKFTEELDKKRGMRYSLFVGLSTALLFLVVLLMGFGFEFGGLIVIPISFGTGLVVYSIASTLFVFRLSRRYIDNESIRLLTPELRDKNTRGRLDELIRVGIALVPAFSWILLWSAISRLGLDVAPPFTFAMDSGAAILRFGYFVALVFLLVPLFYSDALWLNATTGIVKPWREIGEMLGRLGRAMLSRLLGLVILIAALYIPFLIGAQLGFIMFIALLMLPFTVIFALTTLVTVWVGAITRSNLTAAFLNSILLALVLASTFQIL